MIEHGENGRTRNTFIAGLFGAGVMIVLAFAEGVAVEAKGREYDMGGIPLLLAAWGFVPFAAGTAAGLAAPRRPYLAAAIAWVAAAVIGAVINIGSGSDKQVEAFLLPIPVTVPFALWGALIVDRRRTRLVDFRNTSMVLAALMSLLAIIPIADYWMPGKSGWLLAGLVVIFFVWVARRNQRAERATSHHDVTAS
jgi:hypothetical protein